MIQSWLFNGSHSNCYGGSLMKEREMTLIASTFHAAVGLRSSWSVIMSLLAIWHAEDWSMWICTCSRGAVWPKVIRIRIAVSQFSGLNVQQIMDAPSCLSADVVWHQNSSSSWKGWVVKYTNASSHLNPTEAWYNIIPSGSLLMKMCVTSWAIYPCLSGCFNINRVGKTLLHIQSL